MNRGCSRHSPGHRALGQVDDVDGAVADACDVDPIRPRVEGLVVEPARCPGQGDVLDMV